MIINADDFGASKAVNNAIVECFKKGYINRATIMVNEPAFDEACKLAKENGISDKIGLHLNLTHAKPLTKEILKSEVFCSNGEFSGNIKKLANRFYISKRDRELCRKEVAAQLDKYISAGFSLMHIDSHQHIHTNPSVLHIIIDEARKRGFNTMRIARTLSGKEHIQKKMIWKFSNYFIKKNFETTSSFGSYDNFHSNYNAEKGSVEIMVHPTYVNDILVDNVGPDKYVPMNVDSYFRLENGDNIFCTKAISAFKLQKSYSEAMLAKSKIAF